MKNSQAERFQNLVLSISSKSENGLDLSRAAGEKASFIDLPEESFKPGDHVLVVGDNAKIAEQAKTATGEHGSVRHLDKDAEFDDFQTSQSAIAYYLDHSPVRNLKEYQQFQQALADQRRSEPLIVHDSIDAVVLDTVLNRLPAERALSALDESFRVLRRGGRLVILTYLADEPAPLGLPALPTGEQMRLAPVESEVITWLSNAGFHGMKFTWRAELPAHVIAGTELRAFIIEAYKGKQGICLDHGHAVLYKGPWSEVYDDDGHRFVRGQRTAVCAKTYELLMREPYQGEFEGIPSYVQIPESQAPLFDCNTPQIRDPKITKGHKSLFDQSVSCDPNSGGSCGC